LVFFFSSRRRHTRFSRDWSSDVCSSDLDVATRLGITRDKVGSNAANVLGDATVTPLELTNAYATLAAQGMRSTPHIIANVVDARGNLVYQAPGADKRTPVLDRKSIRLNSSHVKISYAVFCLKKKISHHDR